MSSTIQPHNLRAAGVWSRGGKAYEQISRGIADAIEHCVLRLDPQPNERVLDLSTGTGWTSRVVARRGANVIGVDIADGLLDAARLRAATERLAIEYEVADAEHMPFENATRAVPRPRQRSSPASCAPADASRSPTGRLTATSSACSR
jgi:ubiquinone/menaquinone biosynthesis C-methylase UbiE